MSKPLSRILLPSRFQVITSPQNQVVQRLERLRRSKAAREEEGHVVVQGIKTLQELGSKGHHRVRTIGITFDKEKGPVRSPALDVVTAVHLQEDRDTEQYVAVSRKLTTRILGTDSPTAEHEVWAEVAIPDHSALFALSPSQRLLVFDQVSDPGNMGLMVRSAKAFSWDAGWQTPGTVDPFNDKVVRASRALCLDFPMKVGGRWKDLDAFLKSREMVPLVADMVPSWILQHDGRSSSKSTPAAIDPYKLVWWNWPSELPRNRVPEKIALIMSSEHHGVDGRGGRLLGRAIRVSIPMNPAVESMNVAAAATAMMWELNRVLYSQGQNKASTRDNTELQIYDGDT
ncbi:MAG: Alpha/beta knot methyltransferase [Linnemannia gamsii]|nr:MAG: Alpha/beta knot methyltransferase [Linnemannia gamsii]